MLPDEMREKAIELFKQRKGGESQFAGYYSAIEKQYP